MFHQIVKNRLRNSFSRLNEGDPRAALDAMASDCVHRFPGDHALGGERRDPVTTRAWYARLAAIFPDLRFELLDVVVSGWPWSTLAVVTWRDAFTLPNGERGANEGVHVLRMRWGKVVELTVHCDTGKLARYCQAIAAQGVPEAALPPLEQLT
ncbi:MAG: nuclear transport factor 2 family protein [Polyangiales bacterium]